MLLRKHLLTSAGSWKKQETSRKTSISVLSTMPKPLTVWITINCGKFWKRWEYQTTWPASWETYMQVRKQVRTGHGTTDWFQIGKGVRQGCILSPCLFNFYAEYIGIKIAGRNISITSDMQMTPPLWQKVSEVKVKWSCSVLSDSLRPRGLKPTRLLRPWDSPGKDTGVDCHFLLQGIFPTQGSNPGLLHCRQTL